MLNRARHILSLTGRASRGEYAAIMSFGLLLSAAGAMIYPAPGANAAILLGLVNLILFYLIVAVWVRRLHDLGKSGWLLLLWVIPITGVVFIAWGLARPSRPA